MMQNKDFFIVNMKPEDIILVEKIEKETFSEPWGLKSFENGLSDGKNYFIVAKNNDDILGYLGMNCVFPEAYMYNIAVKKDYRRVGIGKALLNSAVSYCLKNKFEFLSLEVRVSNFSAVKLYEKFDFKLMGKRKNFYKYPNEDALILTRYFK